MKNQLLLMLISAFTFLNAQTYQFDKVITTESNGISSQKMINTSNDDYIIFLSSDNAELYDRNSKIKHFYNISYGVNNEISLEYKRSCDESKYFKEIKNSDKWDYRIEKINDNEYVLGQYKSEKSKNPKCEIYIKIEESELGNLNFLHSLDDGFMEKLNLYLDKNKNYTITEIDFSKNGGNKITLKNVVDYEFSIELPKNLMFECKYKFITK